MPSAKQWGTPVPLGASHPSLRALNPKEEKKGEPAARGSASDVHSVSSLPQFISLLWRLGSRLFLFSLFPRYPPPHTNVPALFKDKLTQAPG